MTRNERLFLSWIAPRGIVAASVSALFAFRLVERGYPEAAILEPLVFLVIVGTVLLQGITAKPFAQRLGISEADPQGFLIMGADRFACELGAAIKKAGFVVRLVDVNRANVLSARLRGLDAIQGNILSEYVESELDLSGIGRLLAVTHNDEANSLACQHFEEEFTSQEVYQLVPQLSAREQSALNLPNLGHLLFGPRATCEAINRRLEDGAVIKTTPITDKFTPDDFKRINGGEVIILAAYRGKRVVISTLDRPVSPQTGWTIVSLATERGEAARQTANGGGGSATT